MPNILLIPGSMVGLDYSIFIQKDLKYGTFWGVKDLIDEGKIDLFFWSKRSMFAKFWQLNKVLEFYFLEKHQVSNDVELLQNLFSKIVENNYTTIVAHSMGCELLYKMTEKYGLPKNVKNIYTLASDNPSNTQVHNIEVKHNLNKGNLVWQNYYCYWDQMLIISWFLNKKFPAGLIGDKSKQGIQNIFYLLRGSLALHTSIIKKPTEIKKICLRHL